MDTKQLDTLRLASIMDLSGALPGSVTLQAAAELRRQHTEIEALRASYDAARLEIESLQKAATGRHALQATGAHPAPCARYCEAQAFRITLSNLHAENERLRTCNKDAQHEIAALQERVQQLGQLARDVNSRRVTELEAQLEAIGAGGVEPLRKRECLHQISEPAKAGWCDGCSPDNCGGCAASAAPAQAGEQKRLPLAITSAPERIWLDLGFNPCKDDVHFSHLHDLTWSQNNATGDGIEYVRADLAAHNSLSL